MVASEQHICQTIVQFDKRIVLPGQRETSSTHDYFLLLPPLVGILLEILRIPSLDPLYMGRIPTMNGSHLLNHHFDNNIHNTINIKSYMILTNIFVIF